MKQPAQSAIRAATAADAPTIAALAARVFVETFAPDNKRENIDAYVSAAFAVERVRRELEDPSSVTLIAEHEGSAIGYARLERGAAPESIGGTAPIELVRLYVDASYHGGGTGSALMRAALGAARGAGCDVIWLGVWERNARAQAFYRKWGFERAGEHGFQLGDELQTDYLLRRPV